MKNLFSILLLFAITAFSFTIVTATPVIQKERSTIVQHISKTAVANLNAESLNVGLQVQTIHEATSFNDVAGIHYKVSTIADQVSTYPASNLQDQASTISRIPLTGFRDYGIIKNARLYPHPQNKINRSHIPVPWL